MLQPAWPLRTPRLDLRPYDVGDIDDLRVMATDATVVRYLYWDVMDDVAVRSTLDRKVRQRALRHEGDALSALGVLRDTGEVVGDVILIWRSEEHRGGEVGFILKPAFQGRGFATEMAAEMLHVGFADLDLHRIIGRCDARNTASRTVLERLGMRLEAHLVQNEWVKGEWCDETDYALLAVEWRAVEGRG